MCIKGLKVKIVSSSLKKKLFYILLIFGQFQQKVELLVKSKINFSLQGGSFYLHSYFETYQVKTLTLNQGFP